MLAFHGDESVKAKYLNRVLAHAAADEIIHGKYWERGKGCAVGCTIHSGEHSHYETELGIPRMLARMEDRLFEGAVISVAVAYLIDGKKAVRYRVPSSIAREIVSFDRGQYFSPGAYSLAAPAGSERLGFKRPKRPARKTKRPTPIKRAHKTAGIRCRGSSCTGF